MTHDKQFRSRRDVMTSVGRLYIGRVIAPALGSVALSLPAEATPAPHLTPDESPFSAGSAQPIRCRGFITKSRAFRHT
jgi:hypothetical protein